MSNLTSPFLKQTAKQQSLLIITCCNYFLSFLRCFFYDWVDDEDGVVELLLLEVDNNVHNDENLALNLLSTNGLLVSSRS